MTRQDRTGCALLPFLTTDTDSADSSEQSIIANSLISLSALCETSMLGDADAQCRLLEIAPSSSSSDGILQQCLPICTLHTFRAC